MTDPSAVDLLAAFDREDLRRALWYTRREASRPREVNPAAAQYAIVGVTAAKIRAEYRRRGWKVPKPTRAELP